VKHEKHKQGFRGTVLKQPGRILSASITEDFSMAVTASFTTGAGGRLFVFGDGLDNTIEVGRDAAGKILVNGGAVVIKGGISTVANTSQISIFGQGGNDTITVNEANGALPRASIFAGGGNDVVTGGSGADQLFGQAGNDVLNGKGGVDSLFGGDGNDVLTGGDANDQMFGEAGDDRMIWNPGDDDDLMEGGAGNDTAEINGGNGAEVFTATANGARVRFDRVTPAPFTVDIGTTENLVVNMNGGDDSFSATGNLAALISVTVDGGSGNDSILGGNGNDLLLGGTGDDFIDGQQGNDVALLGAGEDVFQWDPGDGSDVVEGQDGFDTMLFNGSGGNEIMELVANGGRAVFTRNLGNIVMDLNSVEQITVNALGGTDTITIQDTTGTDVQQVNVNLSGTIGGPAGDGAADTVIVNATNGQDFINVLGSAGDLLVSGLNAAVFIADADGANDSLVVNGGAGDDGITATTMGAGNVKLTLDGGDGNDTMLGSQGADVFLGGAGHDFIFGDNGNDVALMGAGDDVFQWDPGDGDDTIEGQDGIDTMLFFGSNASETINIAANGGRVLFLRDVANVTMDLNDVETIDFRALGGADTIVIGDLSGTDVTDINIDLRGPAGGGDGAADTVTVNATNGADVFGVTGDASSVRVFGLQAGVDIFFSEDANDRLVLNGQGSDDVIDASSLEAGALKLTMNGGLGNDVFLGSEGNDLINGGDGDDVALMGAGDDVFVWNPGDDDDTLEGQDGFDEMLFNGANVSETINIFANGGRVLFTRDIASVLMDLNDLEKISFNALGGTDNITVQDLSGTDVTEVSLNLGAVGGADDGQPDTVTVQGTNGDDIILVVGDTTGVRVFGLAAEVQVFNFGAGDRLVINGLAGDDVVEASGLEALGIALVVNGGDGDDVIVGGDGADTLNGDAGDDVIVGGLGLDILNGGTGDNILIQ
jgi:Ca2+-binding RTX toxin-like protein